MISHLPATRARVKSWLRPTIATTLALALSAFPSYGQNSYVTTFGEGGNGDGWKSDDTRDSSGTNLVGTDYTHAPVGTPTSEGDTAIAAQIDWKNAYGSRGNLGGVGLTGTSTGSGKSTLSLIDATTGFGAASVLTAPGFTSTYRWQNTDTVSGGISMKFGIQSTAYGTGAGQSQNGFTAVRSGEPTWDLILVADPADNGNNSTTNGAFYTTTVTAETRFSLFAQASSNYFVTQYGATSSTLGIDAGAKTLAQWQATFINGVDGPTWGDVLFGDGAKISNVQFGMGSGNGDASATLDWASVSFLNSGDIIDFADASQWTGSSGNEFSTAGNWTVNTLNGNQQGPTSTNNVVFTGNVASPVTVSANTVASSVAVGAGSVTLQLASSATLALQNNGFLSAEEGAALNLVGSTGSLISASTIEGWGTVNIATNVTLDGGSVNQPVRNGRYALVVGPGGEVVLQDGANVVVANDSATPIVRVGEGVGTGTLTIQQGSQLSIGTASSYGTFQIGDWGSTGIVNQTGGIVNLIGAGNIGNQGGTGTYNLSGGVFNFGGDTGPGGNVSTFAIGRRTNSSVGVSTGIMNISGDGLLHIIKGLEDSTYFTIGGTADPNSAVLSQGTLNQTGGRILVDIGAFFGFGQGEGTYNLNGGILEVGGTDGIRKYGSSDYDFNLGGGTIKVHTENLTTSLNINLTPGTTSTIDTNGLDATLSGALTGQGGITKTGLGNLALTTGVSDIGQFLINQGSTSIASSVTASGANFVPTTPNTNAGTHRNAFVVQGGSVVNLINGASVAIQRDDQLTAFLRVGYGDTAGGTLNIGSGASLSVGHATRYANFHIGEGIGASGQVNQTGGEVEVKGSFNVGVDGGAGTYKLSGGLFTLDHDDAANNHTSLATIGLNLNAAGPSAGTSTGVLLIEGGTFNVTAHEYAPGQYGSVAVILGNRERGVASYGVGNGEITQTGGLFQVDNRAALYLSSIGNGEYNLNGGVLAIGGNSLQAKYGNQGAGTYEFNLGGGTLRVHDSALTSSINANLLSGVSTLDTNGLSANWSGAFTGTGGLTKTGLGTLNLTNATSSVGQFLINQGTANITSSITASGADFVSTTPNSNAATHRNAFIVQGGSIVNLNNGANVQVKREDQLTAFLRVGYGDTAGGTMNIGSGARVSVGQATRYANFHIGEGIGASGQVNQTGGEVAVKGSFNVGVDGGTGTYKLSSGLFTLDHDDAANNHTSLATIGLNLNTAGPSAGTSSGVLLIEGGTFNVTAHEYAPDEYGSVQLILGNRFDRGEGNGTLTQTGGVLRVGNQSGFHLSSFGDGEYNLNGGVLEIGANSFRENYGNGGGTYAFNFGGGTISVIGSNLTTSVNANLVDGTTSHIENNGYNASFSGDFTGGGSVTVNGTGTTTFSGNNSHTGGTSIFAGTFLVTSDKSLGSGNVTVASSATLAVAQGVSIDIGTGNQIQFASGAAYRKIFGAGEDLSNFGGIKNGTGLETEAQIVAGEASSSLSANASFSTTSLAANDGMRVSDILSLDGLDGEVFVLQLSYNEAAVAAAITAGYIDSEDDLRIAWLTGGEWIVAADGPGYVGVYSGQMTVGAYGVNTADKTVWAVLDHNSEFAVIPEPSTWLLIGFAFSALLIFRRRAGLARKA